MPGVKLEDYASAYKFTLTALGIEVKTFPTMEWKVTAPSESLQDIADMLNMQIKKERQLTQKSDPEPYKTMVEDAIKFMGFTYEVKELRPKEGAKNLVPKGTTL